MGWNFGGIPVGYIASALLLYHHSHSTDGAASGLVITPSRFAPPGGHVAHPSDLHATAPHSPTSLSTSPSERHSSHPQMLLFPTRKRDVHEHPHCSHHPAPPGPEPASSAQPARVERGRTGVGPAVPCLRRGGAPRRICRFRSLFCDFRFRHDGTVFPDRPPGGEHPGKGAPGGDSGPPRPRTSPP